MNEIYQVTTSLTNCGRGKPIAVQCDEHRLALNGTLTNYERFAHTFGPELVAWRVELTVSGSGGDGEYQTAMLGLCARLKGKPDTLMAFVDLLPGMNEQNHMIVLLHELNTALTAELVTA